MALPRILALAVVCAVFGASTWAQAPTSTPGVTPTEIKIGNITCSSGWAQPYAAVARAEAAYFRMVNDQGGINGRKINFVSLDNGCDPARTLELARELVEKENVLLLFSVLGTETNLAIRDYLNARKVPQLFVESSSSVFNDPTRFPWTMGFFASYRTEGLAYGRYILEHKPEAKIAVLAGDDDAGREYVTGLRAGLGIKAATLIVKEATYSIGDSDLPKKVQALKDSGADVFANFAIGPIATQTIRAAFDADWHPLQFLPNASLSVAAFLEPAGLEKAKGVISNARSKGWMRGQSRDDAEVRQFVEWMAKYNSGASLRDQNNVAGYERAQALAAVLKACGDDLNRANVMKQAASLDLELPMLRPGIRVKTTATDYQPIDQLYLIQFDGKEWQPIGTVEGR